MEGKEESPRNDRYGSPPWLVPSSAGAIIHGSIRGTVTACGEGAVDILPGAFLGEVRLFGATFWGVFPVASGVGLFGAGAFSTRADASR